MSTVSDQQTALLESIYVEYGETITYTKAADSSTREITAIVHRGDVISVEGVVAPGIEIEVINDATNGIAASEVDTGLDTLTIAEREGAATTKTLHFRIVEHDQVDMLLEAK